MTGTFFFKNPRLLLLAIAIIITTGLAAFHVIPRMEDPVLTQRVGLVTTTYAGADARRVETSLTERLETALQDIEQIKQIRSSSAVNRSVIVIHLRDEVVEVDAVWSRVRDKLADAATELPEEVSRPQLSVLPLKAYATIVALTWKGEGPANFAILRRVATDLKRSIKAISGSQRVDIFGDPGEEISVEISPQTLAALDLSTADVARQLRGSDARRTAGLLRGESSDTLVAIDSVGTVAEKLAGTPIAYGRGQLVRLDEIASITRGMRHPRHDLALVDAEPSVVLAALIRDDQRIDHWTERFEVTLAAFRSELPDSISADVIFLQNGYVEDRLNRLLSNLLIGAAAVAIVVFVLMGWRSTVVVVTALPLSALMVLAGMRAMEIPVHQMSVTGLIISLGLLIDNAIVIVDEIRSRLWKGLAPLAAISAGVSHLAMPLLGSTLTTTFAFAPIALLAGPSGEFVSSIGISVILAISSSFLLAMTLVPAMTALLQPSQEQGSTRRRSLWTYGLSNQRLRDSYQRSLEWMFRIPLVGVALGVALPVLGFIQGATLPEQFFPASDRDQIQLEIELSSSAPLSKTRQVALAARELALRDSDVARVHWFVGRSAPTFFYNVVPRRTQSPNYAQALVELKSNVDSAEVVQRLQTELDAALTEARVLVRQLAQGPPFEAPVEVRLSGPDLLTLQEFGRNIRLVLSQTPEVLHTRSDVEQSLPRLAVQVDATETRLAGLSEGEIGRQLYGSIEGADGGSLTEGTAELPIRVRWASIDRTNLQRITAAEVQNSLTPDADVQQDRSATRSPTLGALGQLKLTSDVATILHIDGQRMNEIKAYLTAGTLPAEVVLEFERRMAASDFRLPAGYTIGYGGEAAERNDAVGNLLADVALLVALMLATLVISFRSFRISMVIAAVGGLSIGLGSLALWAFGFPFGFMAILGTMGLVGVAINDAIVVMAAIRQDARARLGDVAAISAVVAGRTRHVVATSLTTMAGFTPLVLSGGDFWPPLAIAIAGGVGGATILALYFVPSMYLLMTRIGDRAQEVLHQRLTSHPEMTNLLSDHP